MKTKILRNDGFVLGGPIRSIIDSKLIACVAFCHHDRKPSCLDLSTAVEVLRESKTRALVYNIPTDYELVIEQGNFEWSFIDLLERLPIDDYVILSNTSRAKDVDEAIERALLGKRVFKGLPHSKVQMEPIIKLEILDKSLHSDNEAMLDATKILVTRHNMTVFPLISPDPIILASLHNLGVPLVRVLTGEIGSMRGLIDKPLLKNLAKNSKVPLFFEGGFGTPEHVIDAFSLGASGVLMNAAFQKSENPIELAKAIRKVIDYTIK